MQPSRPATWLDEEPPLGSSWRALFARLVRRGRASWYVWVPLALAISVGVTIRSARRALYEATVVLRVTEGALAAPGTELGAGTLRAYVKDRALTVRRLEDVLTRYARDFPKVRRDPTGAVEDMRDFTDVVVGQNDFVEDRGPGDAPRSARIVINFRASKPELALAVARDLAELIVRSATGLDAEQIERQRLATAKALQNAEAQIDALNAADGNSSGSDEPMRRAAFDARERLRAAVVAATNATVADRASEAQEILHFELIDPGRVPAVASRAYLGARLMGLFLLVMLAGALAAGAFDPRILDRADLMAAGIQVIGETPPLPRRRQGGPAGEPAPPGRRKLRV